MLPRMRAILTALGILLAPILAAAQPGGAPDPTSAAGSPPGLAGAREGVVALPMPADPAQRPLVKVLAAALPAEMVKRLAESAPNLTLITGLNRQTALDHAADANAADARLFSPELLARAPDLVWVHAMSAGVDRLVAAGPLRDSDRIILTNSRAAHGPAIADHVMAMLLTFTRNLTDYSREQAQARWSRESPAAPSIALHGRTMLIVGLGGIGVEVGARAHAFGMTVIATRRTDAAAPDFVQRTGRPADLLSMLPEADVVVLCVPLTTETEGLFGPEAFKAMKPGSILINIARGKVVNTDALIESLVSGRLRGAGLDVTDPEPLPPDHPLWKAPNVLITPHVAADAELTDERIMSLYEENLRRFAAGEPLLNVVDKKAGY